MPLQGELQIEQIWAAMNAGQISFEGAKELLFPYELDSTTGFHFYYFVALRDQRAFWTGDPPAYGLHSTELGTVAISLQTGNILLNGDERLCDNLDRLFDKWLKLGKPKFSEYAMEFFPASSLPSQLSEAWMIKRKFYHQVLCLSNHANVIS